MKLIATIRGQNVAKGLDILTVSQLAEELIIGPKQLSHSRMSLQMSRHFCIEETACVAAKHDKLDGCIVWNAHNTVLGEEALLITF